MSIRAGRFVGLSLFLSSIFLATFSAQAQLTEQSAIAQQSSMRSLIVQPVDESKLAVLKGNTHPLARAQYDQGAAPLDLPMNRMLLVLKRSDAQETTLRKLLDDQQDKSSASYHKWVTPEVFGKQYGPSDQDIQTVTGWLQLHGFQLGEVAKGRNIIEFSGTAGQVQEAFHTAIHKYLVNGEEHWANASDPAIPAALSTVVRGVDSLHNFRKKAMNSFAGTFLKSKDTGRLVPVNPQLTFTGGCTPGGNCYGVVPYDFATIYDVLPLWNNGIDGTGQTIAIVGRTNINPQDVTDFRTFFGLPVNPPNIILNGPDPGINGDESEADIDVQWSGGVAKNATIDFVTSESTETTDGIDLSALYIVDNNLAPVMSESYGLCELALGTSGNAFFATLWEQAASQGISVFISSGDNGAAGCDDPGNVAQDGLNVNGIASTPFNVAVGGTDFNEYNKWSTYWSSTNNSKTQESAIGYIPETSWNDSCANPLSITLGYGATVEAACNNAQLPSGFLNSTGGSGGPSNCIVNSQTLGSCGGGYLKPSWQSGAGVTTDHVRDLPDISLFASNGFLGSSYLICQTDAGGTCSQGFFLGYGGTSVASPAFAGIMALINQKMQAPQGNPNFALYKLASQQPNAFHDVPAGSTIAMPCLAGSGNCTVNNPAHSLGILSGYGTGAGYDLATGLGSVDANNLVNKWSTVTFTATTTSLSLSPINITHGQPVNLNIGVSPSGPTGAVSLLVDIGPGNVAGPAIDVFSLTGNSVSAKTNLLPGGTNYKVFAHYGGDGIFGGSYSTPVSVTVSKENSNVNFPGLLTGVDGSGNPLYSTSVVYGSAYALRVDILNSTKAFCNPPPFGEVACPTGNVALTDNGSPLDLGTYVLNSEGYTEDRLIQLSGGSHALVAQYAGDNSYFASSGSSTVSVTPAGTTTSLQITGSVQVGGTFTATATVNTQSSGAAPSGTVTFLANGTPITGTVTYVGLAGSSTSSALLTASFTAPNFPTSAGTYNITASYSGDQNYAGSTSSATAVTAKYAAPTLTIQAAPPSVAATGSVTLTALIITTHPQPTPTGTVQFNGASSGIISGTVTYTPLVDNNGNNDLQAVLTFVPAGSDTFSAQYSGDTNYPIAQTTTPAAVTVTGTGFGIDFPGQNSVTVTRGQTVQLSLGVVMQSGAAPVTFSSTPCTGLPAEAACGIVPSSVSATGNVQINIKATAPHAQLKMPGNFRQTEWLAASLSTVFAGILLLGGPKKRRRWTTLLSLAIFAALLTLPACGGGSNSGGGGGGGGQSDPGTPVGTSTVTVTATSGTATQTTTFTLVVQ